MDNMKIWDKVSKTDPAHTKRVNQRGGFTAIDAHYQIQVMTEALGPVGEGWGYKVSHGEIFLGDLCFATADVIVWHGNRDNAYGPVRGMTEIMNQKGRIDTDAPKKALTDALTKALSHLGVSADVFLGKFDDNKYIQQLQREKAAYKPTQADKEQVKIIGVAHQNGDTDSLRDELKGLSGDRKAWVWNQLSDDCHEWIKEVMGAK